MPAGGAGQRVVDLGQDEGVGQHSPGADLEREGLPVFAAEFLPPDILASREVLPVYPEIARVVGIAGSYLFKRGDNQRIYDLEEYVALSFAGFRTAPGATVLPAYAPVLEKVKSAIERFS